MQYKGVKNISQFKNLVIYYGIKNLHTCNIHTTYCRNSMGIIMLIQTFPLSLLYGVYMVIISSASH